MSEPMKKALVPVLRFPEFQDAWEWEESTLGSLLDYQQPTNYLVSDTRYSDVYKTPVLTAGKTFILGYTNEQHGIFSEDLPVIIFDDFTTATQFVDFPFKAKSSAMKILQAKKGANIKFMYEVMQTITYEVGTHERHWISKFAPMSILVPTIIEQKIADCLTSIDELVTAQSQKVEALKAHKKGLMQQLFPAEGETVPKLRFPEFRDAGNWQEYQLGQCLSRHPEYGINAPAVPYSDKLPTYLRITDISEDGYFLRNQKVSVANDVTDQNYLSEGDIVLARTGASVGKSYKYRSKDGKLVFAGFLIRVKPDEKKLNSELLFQFLATELYWRWVNLTSTRSGQPGINGNEYSLMPIPLPPSLKEQQKIADILSSIDDLITVQTQKIEALKAHKKGLMQQLFPAIDEVSG